MPVINETQRKLSSNVSRVRYLERRCDDLQDEIEALRRENEQLKEELDESETRRKAVGRRWCVSLRGNTYRAKQMEAIRMILDGEWELDTSRRDDPEIVKAEKPNPIAAFHPFRRVKHG